MTGLKNTHWEQWDLQETRRRLAEMKAKYQQIAFIELNNLFLKVERGEVEMSITVSNQLNTLAGQAYDHDDPMQEYWQNEFNNLPHYLDF